MNTRERYLELDLLRTIAIVMMVIFHAAYDLSVFFNFPIAPYAGGWFLLQRATANLFLLLVGVSFAVSYGRMEARKATRREILMKYTRRGFFVFLCGMLVTAVTAWFVPEAYVRFGVLHLIGVSIALLPFLMPLREGNILAAFLVLLIGRFTGTVPANGCSGCLLPFGWMPSGFVSVDYYPLFPWMATILVGAALGNLFYNRGWLRRHVRDNRWTRVASAPGRHALVMYLVHQPVILLILWLVLK